MSLVLLHNPRCSKSRQALQLLTERGVAFAQRRYLKDHLSLEELRDLQAKLGLPPRKWMRTSDKEYQGLEAASEEELLAALVQSPRLLQRPILIGPEKAVVGRPPEDILQLL